MPAPSEKIPAVPWAVARNGTDEPMLSTAQAMFILNYNGSLWRNGTWRDGVQEAVERLCASGHVRVETARFPFVTHGDRDMVRVVRLKPIPKVYYGRSNPRKAPDRNRNRHLRRKQRELKST